MVHALIIESQESSSLEMRKMITNSFTDVKIVSTIVLTNLDEFQLLKEKIDLVFLDISSCICKTDFSILADFTDSGPELVVISLDNVLPIEVLNLEILYFMEKPISEESLKRALQKIANKNNDKNLLIDSDRISVPVRDGWEIININDILFCKADANYTDIFLKDGGKRKVSKPLKNYDLCLRSKMFFRVHQSYLVNAKYLVKLSKEKSPRVLLSDGMQIPVSRAGKKELSKLFLGL